MWCMMVAVFRVARTLYPTVLVLSSDDSVELWNSIAGDGLAEDKRASDQLNRTFSFSIFFWKTPHIYVVVPVNLKCKQTWTTPIGQKTSKLHSQTLQKFTNIIPKRTISTITRQCATTKKLSTKRVVAWLRCRQSCADIMMMIFPSAWTQPR